jgi:hypothetical protein
MATEAFIERSRRWYRRLLRLYSPAHRERFEESMEQTFGDLCRERAQTGRSVAGVVLWTFLETAAGIFRENGRNIMLKNRFVRIALFVGLVLLLPLMGNLLVDGFNWSPFDFVIFGGVLFAAAATFDVVSRIGTTLAYRAAVAIACVAGFLSFWVNGAVGVIGDDDAANLLLVVVPFCLALVGAAMSQLQPRGMSRTLFAMAAAQATIPVIALAWVPVDKYSPGVAPVMLLNLFWVAMWLTAGMLFRSASRQQGAASPAGEPRSAAI